MKQLAEHLQACAEKDKHIWYADTAGAMLAGAPEGKPPAKELFLRDGLHLSDAGYDL